MPPKHFAFFGFTLMELMVVVAIIGILASALIPGMAERFRDQRAYDAARAMTLEFKKARYRAQNLYRAVGIYVSSSKNKLTRKISIDNTCEGLKNQSSKTVLDLTAQYLDAQILSLHGSSAWLNRWICIRPNGEVVNASTGLPLAADPRGLAIGGILKFYIGRSDAKGHIHELHLPYNGIARLMR